MFRRRNEFFMTPVYSPGYFRQRNERNGARCGGNNGVVQFPGNIAYTRHILIVFYRLLFVIVLITRTYIISREFSGIRV